MPTPLNVLIVEDRHSDAELMAHELRLSEFDPHWKRVETEVEYLEQLTTAPDIILADHTLPQFGARRALELLKDTGLDIPLIVVTGSISEEVAVERIKQGAADYILKDRMARLGFAVKRALEEKKAREEKRQAEEALKCRYKELQTLQEIGEIILTAPDLKTALETILDRAVSIDSFDLGTILLVDPSGEKIQTAASRGYRDPGNLQRQPREGAEGRSHYGAFTPKKTFIVENVAESEGLRTLKKEGIQSVILVPVRVGEKTLGLIQLGNRTQRRFDSDKVRLLEAIGNQMGIAVQKARLHEETHRNLERIRALHEIDLAITSTLDLYTVLNVLLEKIDRSFPYASAITVRLFNKERRLLEPVACRNLNETVWKAEEWSTGRGLANEALRTGVPLMVRDVQTDPRTRDLGFFRRYGLVSYAGVPLIAKRESLGVLGFYTKEEHEFTSGEIEFLKTLAGQAAIAIDNAQLYEQTKKQAAELEKRAEELAKSNKIKDEFLSVMSHELRTPLHVMMGFTGMIREGLLGKINRKQENALEKVLAQADDQLAMINSILQATQLEAQAVKVERSPVSLTDLLSDLKSTYQLPLAKQLKLAWDYPPDLSPVLTDGAKLKQVLYNLISNAIKFTQEGSVAISAQYLPGTKALEFKVADTGVGIPEDHLPKIFDKFYQVDSSETRLFGGVGMGLYIVKRFTELLGGTVEVESEPGKGSTFTVKIPCEKR